MAARETALNVLLACRKEGGWSNGVLKDYILRDKLDSREAALATRLAFGVLQNRLKLDFYLKQLLTGKLRDLHPVLRDILHLGLYQLLEMDRIPGAAAVNESVALTKKYCPKLKHGPGLVNGVLRAASRELPHMPGPKSWVEKFSHPQKLIDLLDGYVGHGNMESMLRANNDAPPTVIQTNTLKTDSASLKDLLEAEGVEVEAHPWMPDCMILRRIGNLERLEAFKNGLFYVQDAAAKLSVLCAGLPETGEPNVLDCCAAPGGKSFAAAIALGGRGQITSCDIHSHKTGLIERGARRLGFHNITARLQDASEFVAEWENAMDTVICDVPCSGYGIIRKKPDIRYKDPDTMKELPRLQLAILRNVSRYVAPGGTLLYSTCTLVERENEAVVERFLKTNDAFYLEKLPLPEIFPDNNGTLRLIPGQYNTDGFFICRLRRKL